MAAVRIALPSERPWANGRYGEVSFRPSGPGDLIAVAEVDGRRAGLGRLVPVEEGIGELGGIYVLPDFRGQGLAREIVAFLVRESPYRQLFCIPFAHLEGFYRGFGFEPVGAGTPVPRELAAKVAWCAGEYPDPVALLLRVAG